MPPRRNKEKFQQLTKFERGIIIGLREGGFSYHVTGARVQRNSSTGMRVWKQRTDEHRTTRKTGRGRWKVTSAHKDRHLLRMAVNDCTASSRQLAARWSTATGYPSRQTIDGCVCNRLMSTEPCKQIGTKLSFQMNPASVCGDHNGRIRVRRYAGKCCLSECIIERHSDLTPGVMVWGAISNHGQSDLLRIEGNLNSNRNVREVLQPEVVPFLQGVPGAIFQQVNALPHVAKTVHDFCSAQHMQLFP
ncbi:transposable element Tc1 transposase [Trichonephila clavipes]|nr:transposable element Tc1 transposase [Trichonephila clavipes]